MSFSVDQLIERHWDRLLPFNAARFASLLGYQVEGFSGTVGSTHVCGYAKASQGQKVIGYNQDEHENRQRFTIAHELAHHLLGHVGAEGSLLDTPAHFSSNVSNDIEAEANAVALQLLMPQNAVRLLIERCGVTSAIDLANAFQVSEAAMVRRLRDMKLIRDHVFVEERHNGSKFTR